MSREVVTSLCCHNYLISLVMLDRQRKPLMRTDVRRRETWEWSDHTQRDQEEVLAWVAQLHSKIARQRLDFHHTQAAEMVGGSAAICTEQLQPATMVRRPKPKHDETTGQYVSNGAAAKAGLNTATLDSAPAQFLGI